MYCGLAAGTSTNWSESSNEFGVVSGTKETTFSLWSSGVTTFWILHFILDTAFQKKILTNWMKFRGQEKKNDHGDGGIDFWGKIKRRKYV